jgi:HlyD family secretion protein
MKKPGLVGGKLLWVGLAVVAAGVGLAFAPGRWFGKEPAAQLNGATVRRGPLRISVLQRGELSAKKYTSIKSEIQGQTTILKLVQEGTIVQPGDFLVRLDSSDLVEKELQQRIARDNARAAFEKAKAQYDIQVSQNESDIEAAERKRRFAEIDLKKYLEGDFQQQKQQDEDNILLAKQKRTQADTTFTWSKTLHDKGFLTQTELDKDDLDFQSADVQLKQAELALRLFTKWEDPKKQDQLNADLAEATRGLDRAKLQAKARISDFEAALSSSDALLKLQEDRLQKYVDQLAKTQITAPVAGMVVYSRTEGRMGMGEAMQEGTTVREGQEILTIPSTGGMIAQASVHESVLKQVSPGLPCTVDVDAIPGVQLHGKVEFVALLPDKGNWWANPSQRLYRTEVSIDDANADMRPGMNCGIEILVEEIPDAVYAPLQSVMLSKGATIAFVARGGATEERTVRVGKQSDKWVQILSGLSEGEEVLLSPPPGFTPQKASDEPGAAGEGDKEKAALRSGDGSPARDGRAHADGPKPGEAPKAAAGDGSQAAAAPQAGGGSPKPASAPAGAAASASPGTSGGSGTR